MTSDPRTAPATTGVLAALEEELGPLRALEGGAARARVLGVELARLELPGGALLVARAGVGKVAAAHAASALLAAGASRLLVVGTCGGLDRRTAVGTLVHAARAVQWDLAVRAGRSLEADPALRDAWRAVAPGVLGQMLTADRPAIRLVDRWRRARALARAGDGDRLLAVAEMETAGAAAVAARAGVPWAALRAVSDAARLGDAGRFLEHLPVQGGRAAATVPALLARLAAPRDGA